MNSTREREIMETSGTDPIQFDVNAQGYGGGNPAPANTATTLGYNDTMYNENVVLPESAFEGVWVLTPVPVNVVVLVPPARVSRRRHGVVIIIIITGNEYTGCCLQGWRYKHGCLISVLELFFICRDGTMDSHNLGDSSEDDSRWKVAVRKNRRKRVISISNSAINIGIDNLLKRSDVSIDNMQHNAVIVDVVGQN
ncbi:uncharacterized protein LOC135197246 isoform X2 [Macrobrachium nipponense]|uniref:uncharacterized protein LOC135197246 isoform X2 n=1 Tax=Macrobrachium nipponense TaxID=159736 RepID=UPI0030C7D91D